MANGDTANNTENEHLLEHKWVCWHRPPTLHGAGHANNWKDSLREEFTANTVEEFWRGFHKTRRITSGHPLNCDYWLFKDGIDPDWDCDFNMRGGRWTCSIERRQSSNPNVPLPDVIGQAWLDVMLCLIGEGFHPHGDKVAGGVCGIRQPGRNSKLQNEHMAAKIHIWTKDASDTETNIKIGQVLKEVLNAADGQLTYSAHETGNSKSRGNFNKSDLKL